MGQETLYLSLAILVRAFLLAIGLFAVIKILKLDWTPFALIASALVVGGLDVIPLVGHFIAPAVLFVCVAIMSHFSLFPGSIVATIVGTALMLGSTCYLDLHLPGHRVKAVPVQAPLITTNAPEADDMIYITNTAGAPAPILTNIPGQTNRTASPYDIARTFTLKSVINNSSNSMATVHTGSRSYQIVVGESLSMDTPNGRIIVHCDKVNVNSVVLTIAGRHVSLYLR